MVLPTLDWVGHLESTGDSGESSEGYSKYYGTQVHFVSSHEEMTGPVWVEMPDITTVMLAEVA
jgi:hypothetical protein